MDTQIAYTIPDFPDYELTDSGRVFNKRSGREMILSPNQNGDLSVGMMLDGRQYRRSVKLLVARMFVEGETNIFNTPVLLDGNREHMWAENIVWRPRWFAWEYQRQFSVNPDFFNYGPLINDMTRDEFRTVFEAMSNDGVLAKEIVVSCIDGNDTFPNGHTYSWR